MRVAITVTRPSGGWSSALRRLLLVAALAGSLAPGGAVRGDEAGGASRPLDGQGVAERSDARAASALLDQPVPVRSRQTRLRLSLHDTVRLALQRNLQIEVARVDQDIRQREVTVERAVFDPFLTLGYDFDDRRSPTASFLDIGAGGLVPEVQVNPTERTTYFGSVGGRTLLGTTYDLRLTDTSFDRPLSGLFGINPQESLSATATLTQPLLRGGWYAYNAARLRIAFNNQEISREDFELAASDLIYQVEAAYWQLVFAWKNFEAKQNSLRVSRENLDNARKKQQAGLLARTDVTLVESQVALRLIEMNDADTLLESARDTLLDLVNHGGTREDSRWQRTRGETNPFDDVEVVPTTEPDDSPFLPDRDESLRLAFEQRSEYRRLDLFVENQRLQAEVAENEILPRLDLTASWSQFGLDDSVEGAFDSLGTGRFYGWAVGVQLEVPLSSRGAKARYRLAVDQLIKLQLQRQQLENQIVLEVDQSVRELGSLHRKIQYTEEQVRLQELLYQDELDKLGAGKSIPYTVAEIRNDLVDRQAQALRAKADYMTARAAYHRNLGGLLRRFGLTLEDAGGR